MQLLNSKYLLPEEQDQQLPSLPCSFHLKQSHEVYVFKTNSVTLQNPCSCYNLGGVQSLAFDEGDG